MSQETIEKLESFIDGYKPVYPIPTLESIFQDTPEGDFSWEPYEAGDWEVWYDTDSQSWNKVAYVVNIGRKNGYRWIEVKSCDSDGNWEIEVYFDEEDDNFESFAHDYMGYFSTEDYFQGWAEYWLYCAKEGTDPLDQCFPGDYQSRIQDGTWVEFCLNSAKDNIKCLEGGKDFLATL